MIWTCCWSARGSATWRRDGTFPASHTTFADWLRSAGWISFDKQGMGLSDPIALDRLPPLEEWMDDVRAVLDAVGCMRVAVMGANEGNAMAALFAATYPERYRPRARHGNCASGFGS